MIHRIMQVEIVTAEDEGYEYIEEGDCEVFVRDPRRNIILAQFSGYASDWVPND